MKDKLRLIRNLLEKRSARRKTERFVVEGPHLVCEAGELIDFIVYSDNLPIVSRLSKKGIQCLKVSRQQFLDISQVETPQGVLAVVKQQVYTLDNILTKTAPLIVFCIGIQDPGNLGTIIRTADAVAASGVILSRGTVDLYNQKVIRSTMGSLFHLPIAQVVDPLETIKKLKAKNIQVIATFLSGARDHFKLEYNKACAILVGNEGAGLPKEIVAAADEVVKIPIPGKAESLNAGISTAVILYEALRQRKLG